MRYNQYRGGGPIVGPSHANGGVKIAVENGQYPVIEAEGGEFIVSKDAMEKYGHEIVAMNEDGNNSSLLEGYYQNGGPLLPSVENTPVYNTPPTGDDSKTWIRSAVEKYIPSDEPSDTEALINFGEAILPVRLPTMDDFRAIWASDNPAQEMMNFGVMLALTKGKGAFKKPKKKRVTPQNVKTDANRQIKKLEIGRQEGRVPITKGGQEKTNIHASEQTAFGGLKKRYDAEHSLSTKVHSRPSGGVLEIKDPTSIYDGFTAIHMSDGSFKIIDKKGQSVKNPRNKRDMDSHDYGDIKKMMQEAGVIDDDIHYYVHGVKKPDAKSFKEAVQSSRVEESIRARNPDADILPITRVGEPRILPIEKNTLPQNGGRIHVVDVDGKPVVIQGSRYDDATANKRGWFKVSEKELADPSAKRVTDLNSDSYLGRTKQEALVTLRAGENPQQRHLRKQQKQIKKIQADRPVTTPGPESQMIPADRGDATRMIRRLLKEQAKAKKKKEMVRKKQSSYNAKFANAQREGKVPAGMTRQEWIDNQIYTEEIIQVMNKNRKKGGQ